MGIETKPTSQSEAGRVKLGGVSTCARIGTSGHIHHRQAFESSGLAAVFYL
jgi:hypothetical protein